MTARLRLGMSRIVAGVAAVLALSSAAAIGAQAPASKTAPASASAAAIKPVIDKYCVGCHNERRKASYANLALDTLDLGNVAAHAATWEKVVSKLRAGTMPPTVTWPPRKLSCGACSK